MNFQKIKTIGVIGAGTMGVGIAQVAAMAGYQVIVFDSNPSAFDIAKVKIRANLDKLCLKGAISTINRDDALAKITKKDSLEDFKDVDFIIEAASENPEIKFEIFRRLDKICRPDVILGTNTSSISVTEISKMVEDGKKVIGMHFMNPVPIMKLVEIVMGSKTSDETLKVTQALAKKLDKKTVLANDFPEFIVNRILMPELNEAMHALMEVVSTIKDIDTGMVLGCAHPMGPLTLADFIGLDVCLAIMKVMYQGLNDDKYRPCPLLEKMVAAGLFGNKTPDKGGFYLNGQPNPEVAELMKA